MAAAYWLLQTRPVSGKRSTLQQLFQALPNAESLFQTAVFDLLCRVCFSSFICDLLVYFKNALYWISSDLLVLKSKIHIELETSFIIRQHSTSLSVLCPAVKSSGLLQCGLRLTVPIQC